MSFQACSGHYILCKNYLEVLHFQYAFLTFDYTYNNPTSSVERFDNYILTRIEKWKMLQDGNLERIELG